MKNFSIQALAGVLTAKERAKIIAEYIVKGDETGEDLSHEINKIKMNMSSNQITEFNFYMDMIQTVHVVMEADFQTMYLRFFLYSQQLEKIYQQWSMSIYSHFTRRDLNWLPKIVTPQGYRELYEEQKAQELSAVFSLETLAEHEALAKIQSEGWWQDTDLFMVHKQLVADANKTEDQLINEYLDHVEERVATYLEYKDKKNAFLHLYQEYSEYEGKSRDEMREMVTAKYDFTPTDPADTQKWLGEIENQKQQLQKLIDEGVLEAAVVGSEFGFYGTSEDEGKQGITAASWYNYLEKYDTGFNDFIDDVDNLIYFCHNDVAIIQTKQSQEKKTDDLTANIIKKRLLEHLDHFNAITYEPISGDKKLHLEAKTLERIKELLFSISVIKLRFLAYIRVIETVEDFYFDGTQIVSRKTWYAKAAQEHYDFMLQQHQQYIDFVYNYFGNFTIGSVNPVFDCHDDIQFVEPTEEEIQKVTKEQMGFMLEKATKDSHFRPSRTPFDERV